MILGACCLSGRRMFECDDNAKRQTTQYLFALCTRVMPSLATVLLLPENLLANALTQNGHDPTAHNVKAEL